MVEVFKTNIDNAHKADCILKKLQEEFPDCKINFDLEDCDNILRMESGNRVIHVPPVIYLVRNYGFEIEVLPDSPVTKHVLTK